MPYEGSFLSSCNKAAYWFNNNVFNIECHSTIVNNRVLLTEEGINWNAVPRNWQKNKPSRLCQVRAKIVIEQAKKNKIVRMVIAGNSKRAAGRDATGCLPLWWWMVTTTFNHPSESFIDIYFSFSVFFKGLSAVWMSSRRVIYDC